MTVHASDTTATRFDQTTPGKSEILRTGQLYSRRLPPGPSLGPPLNLDASDLSAQQLTLRVEPLPLGAVVLKNRDGSHTLMWIPQEQDIGSVTLRVYDGSRERSWPDINLTVVDLEHYEQQRQQQLFRVTAPEPLESSRLDAETTAQPGENPQDTAPLLPADTAVIPTGASTSAGSHPVPMPTANPVIQVENEIPVVTGSTSTISVTVESGEQGLMLRALNLPKAAVLAHTGTVSGKGATNALTRDYYTLRWTPPPGRATTTVVILQLVRGKTIIASRRVRLTTAL